MSTTLRISEEYMAREAAKERWIRKWIVAYCNRNCIEVNGLNVYDRSFGGSESPYLVLNFRTRWQLNCFVTRGNREFPCFEFR